MKPNFSLKIFEVDYGRRNMFIEKRKPPLQKNDKYRIKLKM